MRYDIQFKPKAAHDMRKLPKALRNRIFEKLNLMKDDLYGDVKKLTNFTPEYRLRVGDYRILFEVQGSEVIVYRILHRRDAYQ